MARSLTFIDHLRAVDLFRDFDDVSLGLLAATAQDRRYRAGQTLFMRGDAADSMFMVSSGKIRLSISTAEGAELALRHVGEGTVFGEIALLDGGERTADAVALQDSTVLTISRGGLAPIVDAHPNLATALIIGLCRRLRDITDQLEAIALLPLEQRLARLLLHLAKAAGKATGSSVRHAEVALDITQGEMATLIGASRPKVNQVLVGWHVAGIAVRAPKGLRIDQARMRTIAESDDG